MRSPTTSERLAGDLAGGLRLELDLTPKPGLVDREDCGSHPDLTYERMDRSVALAGECLARLAASLSAGEPVARQVALGLEGEREMHRRFETNTHKGAIFLGGLLLSARERRPGTDLARLRPVVAEVARDVLAGRVLPRSHGQAARGRFGVGGVVGEALSGMPSLFDVALPAARLALDRGFDPETAAFAMMAGLMQVVEDTTALHRCGTAGLARLRADGRELQRLVLAGVDPRPALRELNEAYRVIGLTMGGVADLLAMALGIAVHLGWIPAP